MLSNILHILLSYLPQEEQDIFLFCLLLYHEYLKQYPEYSRLSINICGMNNWDVLDLQCMVSLKKKNSVLYAQDLVQLKLFYFSSLLFDYSRY